MFWANEYCDKETCFALKDLGYPWIPIKVRNGCSAPVYYSLPKDHPDWQNCDAYYAITIYEAHTWLRKELGYHIEVSKHGKRWFATIVHNNSELRVTVASTESFENALLSGIYACVLLIKGNKMKIKTLKKHMNAELPKKAYPNDFCYDCVAVSEEEIAPNVWKYGLGLAFQIERDTETLITSTCFDAGKQKLHCTKMDFSRSPINLSIDARPRSSVWKTGMILSNCQGTIDENYIGEVSAVFYHVMPNMPRYKVGERVCQIKLGFTLPMEFEFVNTLEKTDRGANGYGSSGK